MQRTSYVLTGEAMVLCLCLLSGCASTEMSSPPVQFPPAPQYPPDHRYTLDELLELSIHRNASLDVARYEAEAVEGLVDRVKALWLPALRWDAPPSITTTT